MFQYLNQEGCEGVCAVVWNGMKNPTLRRADRELLNQQLAPQKEKLRRLIDEEVEFGPGKKRQTLLQVGAGAGLIFEKVFPLIDAHLSK